MTGLATRTRQRTTQTSASATGGGTHRGGRVYAIVLEVKRIACHFVQRHGADGAEKGQARSGQEGLVHGLLACFLSNLFEILRDTF